MELTAASFMSVKKTKEREKEKKCLKTATYISCYALGSFFFSRVCAVTVFLSFGRWLTVSGEKKADSDKRNKGNWKGFANLSNAELRGLSALIEKSPVLF